MKLGLYAKLYDDALREYRRTRRKTPPKRFMAGYRYPDEIREAFWRVHRMLARDWLIMVRRSIAAVPR